jgi:hypothetical protein
VLLTFEWVPETHGGTGRLVGCIEQKERNKTRTKRWLTSARRGNETLDGGLGCTYYRTKEREGRRGRWGWREERKRGNAEISYTLP